MFQGKINFYVTRLPHPSFQPSQSAPSQPAQSAPSQLGQSASYQSTQSAFSQRALSALFQPTQSAPHGEIPACKCTTVETLCETKEKIRSCSKQANNEEQNEANTDKKLVSLNTDSEATDTTSYSSWRPAIPKDYDFDCNVSKKKESCYQTSLRSNCMQPDSPLVPTLAIKAENDDYFVPDADLDSLRASSATTNPPKISSGTNGTPRLNVDDATLGSRNEVASESPDYIYQDKESTNDKAASIDNDMIYDCFGATEYSDIDETKKELEYEKLTKAEDKQHYAELKDFHNGNSNLTENTKTILQTWFCYRR